MTTPSLNRPDSPVAGLVTPVRMPAPQVVERPAKDLSGWTMLAVALLLLGLSFVSFVSAFAVDGAQIAVLLLGAVVLGLAGLSTLFGLTAVAPGQARVVQLLGKYKGTIRTDGLRWVNPLSSRSRISTRIPKASMVSNLLVVLCGDRDAQPVVNAGSLY
jgi:hypothetical protein